MKKILKRYHTICQKNILNQFVRSLKNQKLSVREVAHFVSDFSKQLDQMTRGGKRKLKDSENWLKRILGNLVEEHI